MIATNRPKGTTSRNAPAIPAVSRSTSSEPTLDGPRPDERSAEQPTPAEAARLVARLFPEVYRQFHSGGRLHYGADLPMTRRSLEVLRHLAAAGPLTVGEQAEHLGLRRNSVSELLQRLERRGLVARIRDERDERRVLVWLTDAGQDVVARIGEVLAPDRLEQSLERLSPDDRAIVVRGFELLARAEEPGAVDRPGPAEGHGSARSATAKAPPAAAMAPPATATAGPTTMSTAPASASSPNRSTGLPTTPEDARTRR